LIECASRAHPQAVNALPGIRRSAGHRVRRIAPARHGDLITVTGDPLADLRLLRHLALVVKGGEALLEPHDWLPAQAR